MRSSRIINFLLLLVVIFFKIMMESCHFLQGDHPLVLGEFLKNPGKSWHPVGSRSETILTARILNFVAEFCNVCLCVRACDECVRACVCDVCVCVFVCVRLQLVLAMQSVTQLNKGSTHP